MKNKTIIKQLIKNYIEEEDDYFEAKSSFIKEINEVFLTYGDNRGIVCGCELTEIVNKQLELLGLNGVSISV
jgi:hypothetical protein